MPGVRKPTVVLAAKGAFDHNRDRTREDFTAGEFDTTAPEYLNDDERAVWAEVTGVLPAGVLQSTDRIAVELVTRLTAAFRAMAPEDISPAFVAQLRTALATLGMTPADRSRVGFTKPVAKNPFMELIGKKSA